MRSRRLLRRCALAIPLLAALATEAGGPISVCSNNAPVAYSPPAVSLNYDLGSNGTRTKVQMDAIVSNAIALWTNVGTATISINRGADLSFDVTSANFSTLLNAFADGINPVIYDSDGEIIDTLFGDNQKNSTLGFAGSAFFTAPPCRFAEGRAVISGFLPVSDSTMSVTIAHEIGHLIGMDHSQLDSTQGLASANFPLMYPIAARTSSSLHEDDLAAVSAIYPDAGLNGTYGQISGTFTLADGITPVRGANLWARETTTNKLYSVVSDYLLQNTGFFKLLLPPGTYELRAEAIQTNFIGGSSVGPYSEDLSQPSFQAPLYTTPGVTPMAPVVLGGGTPTTFSIIAGCAATLNFRINGTGSVGGNCQVATFALSVSRSGAGTGTVTSTPAGINCGATCTFNFNSGVQVTLTAAPAGGSIFIGWTGGGCAGTGACVVTMNAATSVTANFATLAGLPTVATMPATVPFGGQSMGTTAPAQAVTVTNIGTGTLTISNVAMSNAQFAQTNNCTSLASGASCTINVTFTPTPAAGALLSTTSVTGNLSITSNGVGSPNVVSLTGTGEKSLVTHYYRSILRRAPDAGGKAFWESEATRLAGLAANVNETWFAMATFFYFSGEYTAFGRNDTQFVTDLYNTFFNRGPDAGGLAFWTGQIAAGVPREIILVSFMFSSEFQTFTQGIFGNTAARKEVDTVVDFYRGLLSRLPDTNGFNFWVQQFRTAQCAGAAAVNTQVESISSGFMNSGEYTSRNRSNAQFVGDIYNSFLRRGGDQGGVLFWIGQLNGGATRNSIRQQFIASPEFQTRVAAIIAQGCLP